MSGSAVIIIIGMALLIVSLVARRTDAPELVATVSSWAGAALVIIGTGRMLFLER
jgi:NAD/NADP transhydrogenase beta subunit